MKRFICFSSGAQRRYRDDIIRAMAMPAGCELNFRYRLKYLANSVQEHLEQGRIGPGDEVLISYLDQSDRSQPVFFIPVRYATILEAPRIGDFAVLRMRVEEFAYAANLDALNREVQILSAEVPKWPDDIASQHATGSFWVEVSDFPKSVVESSSILHWQTVVGQLLARKDFANVGPFYEVVKLQELKTNSALDMVDGQFSLRANTEYELIIDHFLQREETGTCQLEALFTGQAITFITGAKIQLDSPYDRHWLRFKTQGPLKEERAVITITKKQSGEDSAVQFDLPVVVGGRELKTILIGIVVGLFLALPQVITAWVNPAFAPRGLTWLLGLAGIIVLLNVVVGVAAALNFRKPI
jgi:hypothetical protein